MKEIVIVLLPKEASSDALEAALRKWAPAPHIEGSQTDTAPTDFERRAADESPLWTWFVPNPCPAGGSCS